MPHGGSNLILSYQLFKARVHNLKHGQIQLRKFSPKLGLRAEKISPVKTSTCLLSQKHYLGPSYIFAAHMVPTEWLGKESELMALECYHLAGFSSEAASRFLLRSRMQMNKFPSLTPLASLSALPGAVSFDRRCKVGTMGDGETGGNHEIPQIPLLVLPLMVQSRSRLPRFHHELETWSDLFLSQLQCL